MSSHKCIGCGWGLELGREMKPSGKKGTGLSENRVSHMLVFQRTEYPIYLYFRWQNVPYSYKYVCVTYINILQRVCWNSAVPSETVLEHEGRNGLLLPVATAGLVPVYGGKSVCCHMWLKWASLEHDVALTVEHLMIRRSKNVWRVLSRRGWESVPRALPRNNEVGDVIVPVFPRTIMFWLTLWCRNYFFNFSTLCI